MPPFRSAPVIGLIGGIGSGKTAIAQWLAAHRNVEVIQGDALGHQALREPAVQQRLVQHFGRDILDENGGIDRAALAARVFGGSAAQQKARAELEEVVHPVIRRLICETISRFQASKDIEAIILDAAVLLEAGWQDVCNVVVFVETPRDIRANRVKRHRNWSDEELKRREASQLSPEKKQSQAQFTIVNTSTIEHAGRQLEEILNRWSSSGVDTDKQL